MISSCETIDRIKLSITIEQAEDRSHGIAAIDYLVLLAKVQASTRMVKMKDQIEPMESQLSASASQTVAENEEQR